MRPFREPAAGASAARVEPSDAALNALLDRCARHDAAALAELYALVAPLLFGSLVRILRRRALAEEALQDVFVRIWQSADRFDERRGRALAWLVSMARYRAIDVLRRERAMPVDPASLENDASADAAIADEVASDRDLARLDDCLARLPEEQRTSLRLAYADGRSHGDIAAALARPLGSVKSWVRRGLLSLKECMQACGNPTGN
jgi:RNA polymerase sigma-70 factor (ECF subfamily)